MVGGSVWSGKGERAELTARDSGGEREREREREREKEIDIDA